MTDCKNRSNEKTMQGHCKDLYIVEMEKKRLQKHVRNGTSRTNDGLMQQDGMTKRWGGTCHYYSKVITYMNKSKR